MVCRNLMFLISFLLFFFYCPFEQLDVCWNNYTAFIFSRSLSPPPPPPPPPLSLSLSLSLSLARSLALFVNSSLVYFFLFFSSSIFSASVSFNAPFCLHYRSRLQILSLFSFQVTSNSYWETLANLSNINMYI